MTWRCPMCGVGAQSARAGLYWCSDGHAWAPGDRAARVVYAAMGGASWDSEMEATRERYRRAAAEIVRGLG